jgi:pimeloyl-ACP methyl ester carboxylesterase
LTDRELKHYADAFKAGGFSGPINWYRNWTHNWAITKGIPQQVRAATLFIGAVDDVVVSPAQIQAMRAHVPDLEIRMIDDCGHWTQQEHPDRTNALMLEWMSRRYKA